MPHCGIKFRDSQAIDIRRLIFRPETYPLPDAKRPHLWRRDRRGRVDAQPRHSQDRSVEHLGTKRAFRILLFVASVVFLGGCNRQQQRMESSLNPYMGRSVAEFAADHGYPTSTVSLSDDESSFRWVITGQGVGAVIPVGGSLIVAPPTQRVCTVSLRAKTQSPQPELKDWIIQSWNWQGAC